MKRNFTDASARSTAGCLPVPLFNQKRRSRQPLTSNPLTNEPTASNSVDALDFSAMFSDFGWGAAAKAEEPNRPQKTLGTNQTELSMLPPLLKHQNTTLPSAGRNFNNWRLEEKDVGSSKWQLSAYPAFGGRTENKTIPKFDTSDGLMGTEAQQQKFPGHPQALQSRKVGAAEHSYSFTGRGPAGPNTASRGSHNQSTSYTFKHDPYQQNVSKNTADLTQDDKRTQNVPAYQLKLKERDNSLRIVSAVIESMKYWSQHTSKAPLLFEVLGILDSAVTPGQYGAKSFLLRDGKESVSCIFYEIDRELPRLIRGRVHRCMGTYDAKRKLLRCVSVRPATASEQQTFQDFVKIADVEMNEYVKTSNEV